MAPCWDHHFRSLDPSNLAFGKVLNKVLSGHHLFSGRRTPLPPQESLAPRLYHHSMPSPLAINYEHDRSAPISEELKPTLKFEDDMDLDVSFWDNK